MDNETKDRLMQAVMRSTLRVVQYSFKEYKLIKDETFFDYELLKAALQRRHLSITKFLLTLGCRVRNPNKANLEETALHLAEKLNNYEILRKLLKNGASFSDKNLSGETVLYAAFKAGNGIAVNIILTHFITIHNEQKSLNPKDKDNIVHFHIACVTNHTDAIELYLRQGFDVNSPISLDSAEFSGLNPLQYAASKRNYCTFKTLLKFGGDLSIKNSIGQTPLQILYYKGIDKLMIQTAFQEGNDTKFINFVDNNGVSHFHLCCTINHPDFVQVFIKNGVDINSPISSSCAVCPGFTPLHFAVMHGCSEVVQLLLENGADCKKIDKEGKTPLHLACNLQIQDNIKIIEMLLAYNACPTIVDQKGCTPLHIAFYSIPDRKKRILDQLISKIPREVNFSDDQGLTHFHIVCTRNDVSRVNDFLRFGVPIDSCVVSGSYSGYTALHFAVLYNQKDVVQLLLRQNAKVNIKSTLQITPLHLACSYNHHRIKFHDIGAYSESVRAEYFASNFSSHIDIIDLLILYGADVDAQDSSERTPLLSACTIDSDKKYNNIYNNDSVDDEINKRTENIIRILLFNKANINARTNRQESILHIMSEKYFPDMLYLIEYILFKGADINAVDNTGLTPLHIAVKSSKEKVVQIFLKYRANVHAKSKDSLSPLMLALQNGYEYSLSVDKDILCALIEYDSDNVEDEKYRTLLLNKAVVQCEVFAIKKLLYYGADINMEDALGNSTVFSLFTWDSIPIESSSWINLLYAKIFQIIFTHVQKLLALNCHVSEQVQTCCIKLRQRYENVI